MNHKDKNKGTRRQKTGALLVIQKMQSIPVCLGSKEGRGAGRKPPCALSAVLVPPRRSVAETLALALLHKLLGGPQLVAHDAQQLLRLLQEIEID